MAVQLAGLRTQVDPHWKRGLSYLKIGLRWLKGVVNKGRILLSPIPLLSQDPQPCFASQCQRSPLTKLLKPPLCSRKLFSCWDCPSSVPSY